MALTPSRSCYWVQITETDSPALKGGSAMVRAFNKRDEAALQAVLDEHPDALQVRMVWNKTLDDPDWWTKGLSAAEAAVRMNWGAALPRLKQAGETFAERENPGALALATSARNAALVRTLLSLGVDPNGKAGSPALSHLRQKNIDPMRERVCVRICKAYAKYGVDVWQPVEKPVPRTLPEHLLTHLSIVPCRELVASARQANQTPPATLLDNPEQFWQSMVRCLDAIFDQDTWSALPKNVPLLADITRDACALGIALTHQDVQYMTSRVVSNLEKYSGSQARNGEVAKAWLVMCDTFLTLCPQPGMLQSTLAQQLASPGGTSADVVSEWVKKSLVDRQAEIHFNHPRRPRQRL